jgi:hypothetical protein
MCPKYHDCCHRDVTARGSHCSVSAVALLDRGHTSVFPVGTLICGVHNALWLQGRLFTWTALHAFCREFTSHRPNLEIPAGRLICTEQNLVRLQGGYFACTALQCSFLGLYFVWAKCNIFFNLPQPWNPRAQYLDFEHQNRNITSVKHGQSVVLRL